ICVPVKAGIQSGFPPSREPKRCGALSPGENLPGKQKTPRPKGHGAFPYRFENDQPALSALSSSSVAPMMPPTTAAVASTPPPIAAPLMNHLLRTEERRG